MSTEAEQLRAKLKLIEGELAWQQEETVRLRAVAEPARAFVEQHLVGQPGTPGSLYPMTYGVQDEWHNEWDRRLAALIAACQT